MGNSERLWKKSTASGSGGCINVARIGGVILVRDSKDPSGPTLSFSSAEWREFLVNTCADQFDINTTESTR
jgi:hypothetical protein